MNPMLQLNAYVEKIEKEGNLKPASQSVYIALFSINNKTGWKGRFQAVFGQILSITGIANVKTYYSALEELVKGGYILYEKGPHQYRAATFSLVVLYQKTVEHTEQHTEQHTVEQGESIRNSTRLSKYNILKHINNKPVNISFDDFWNLYDHKKDKPVCEKLWQKLSDLDREVIIKNVPETSQNLPKQ